MLAVPKVTTYITSYARNVNSEHINFAGSKDGVKNCYLIFNSGDCEDVLYSRGVRKVRQSMDLYFGTDLERCYEGVNVEQSTGIVWGQNITGCLDSYFLLDCSGCQNCFGCVNLRHKSYYFLNKPLAKEEYKKRVNEVLGSYSKTQAFAKKFQDFSLQFPRRQHHNYKVVNATGEFLFESKNLVNCFEVTHAEDGKYMYFMKGTKEGYDGIGYGYDSELLFQVVAVGYSQRIIASAWTDWSHDVEYSFGLRQSENCFGCDGLKNAKFSILNKTYSEENYRKIREKIVTELQEKNLYGQIFSEISPFAYNECVGQDNMPLSKEESEKLGFTWREEFQVTQGLETMKTENIPDQIRDVTDGIKNEVLSCVQCGRNYKIISAELDFYRRMNLPLPRNCFYCRHKNRIAKRGPFKLFDRTCTHCGKPLKTNFAPDRPEIVYCEQCYQTEVL